MQIERVPFLQRHPQVSVLMPVKNAERHLASAVRSILDQSLADFELVTIDDGSKDSSLDLLRKLAEEDDRLIVQQNLGHKGIAHSLNLGLSVARGNFIARMDADDIAVPHRLQVQVDFALAHPDIMLLGSATQLMDGFGKDLDVYHVPQSPLSVHFHSLFGTPFAHPTLLMRAELFRSHNYRYRELPAQDYDLWVRILNDGHRGENLQVALTRYRLHSDSDSGNRAAACRDAANAISFSQIARFAPGLPETSVTLRLRYLGASVLTGNQMGYDVGDSRLVDLITATLEDFLSISNADAQCAEELRNLVAEGCAQHLAQRKLDKGRWRANRYVNARSLRNAFARCLQKLTA